MMLFANNFAYLTSCGFRTELRFSCSEDGKIITDIHSDLGHFASLFPPPPIITPKPTTTTKYLFNVSQCNTYNVQYISQDGCTLPSGHLVVGPY